MKLHANAALSFRQRERMVRRVVDEGRSVREAASAAEVSARTAGKWVVRYRAEGLIHIDVKKLGRIHGGAGKRIAGHRRNSLKTRVDRDSVLVRLANRQR